VLSLLALDAGLCLGYQGSLSLRLLVFLSRLHPPPDTRASWQTASTIGGVQEQSQPNPNSSLIGSSEAVMAALVAYGRDEGSVRLAHKDSTNAAAVGPWIAPRRELREEAEERILAPLATRAVGAGNRSIEEEPDEHRTCFERDVDRVKYSKPFRRLAGKCQVFIAPDDAHLRNRLTHAIEVAQVATTIAQAVGLNRALVEAIALGHDCGHGPGGHASEDAFSIYMPSGSYDHAVYGADVTLDHLNLCHETLDGIRQHSWRLAASKTPEGELVAIADRLAYCAHDADDAIRSGIITVDDLPAVVREVCGTRQSVQIGSLVAGVIKAVETTGLIGMTLETAEALDAFRKFNYERIYFRPASLKQAEKVVRMLRALVECYADSPGLIPDVARGEWPAASSGSAEAYQLSVRYVSGMTDRFAIAQAVTLLSWSVADTPAAV
jgi:dGTPase